MSENNKVPSNKRKKLIVTISIVAAVLLAGGGGYALYSHANSKNDVSAEVSSSEKDAKKDLDAAQKEFDAAKKTYDALPDDASKTNREKAYNSLQAAYSKLESAQKAALKNASKSDSEKINKELAANKKVVDEAKNKLDSATASEKEEAASTPEATEEAKAEEKSTPEPAKQSTTKKDNSQAQKSNNKQNTTAKKQSCHVVNHPAVTHQETAYTTVHHDEVSHMESYVVTPAKDEPVESGTAYVCSQCRQQFNTIDELDYHIAAAHGGTGSYYTVPTYQTVHHDAVMGQRKVVDKPAYDEQVPNGTYTVTDKEAWQETVCD